MPNTPADLSSASHLAQKLAMLEAKVNALAGQQSYYLQPGMNIYVLDSSGNAQIILGDISSAPQGVGSSSTFNVSTGLTGRGLAVNEAGTWRSLAGFTYP